jgi:hypothetical protein
VKVASDSDSLGPALVAGVVVAIIFGCFCQLIGGYFLLYRVYKKTSPAAGNDERQINPLNIRMQKLHQKVTMTKGLGMMAPHCQ